MKKILIILFSIMCLMPFVVEAGSISSTSIFDVEGNIVTLKDNKNLKVEGDIDASDALTAGGQMWAAPNHYIRGGNLSSSSTTSVTVEAPFEGVNNSHFYMQSSDILHIFDEFSEGSYNYLYIDDSESTYPLNINLTDSATAPSKCTSKGGWYNGNDRCIGTFYCDTANTIYYFDCSDLGGGTLEIIFQLKVALGSAINPDGTWQIPDDFESSQKTPVNAVAAYIIVYAQDLDSVCQAAATTYEMMTHESANTAYHIFNMASLGYAWVSDWVMLGISRNVRVFAQDNDDNGSLYVDIKGYRFVR